MADKQILEPYARQIEKYVIELDTELRPAGKDFVLAAIEVLEERYFQVSRDERIQDVLDAEWESDMEHYPQDLITKACTNWRRSSKGYAPKSAGQLMDSVNQEFINMQSAQRKCRDILRLLEGK